MIEIANFCNEIEDFEDKFKNFETHLGKAYDLEKNILYLFREQQESLIEHCDLIYRPDYAKEAKIAALGEKHQHIHFSGAGGCGKSYRLIRLIKYFSYAEVPFYATASTGTAVSNLRFADDALAGRYMTIHRWAGLGCRPPEDARDIKFLIIDEISMIGEFLWRKIVGLVNSNKGLIMITSGDFNQLQPVKDNPILEITYEENKCKVKNNMGVFWMPLCINFTTPYRFTPEYYDFLMNAVLIKKTSDILKTIPKVSVDAAIAENFTVLSYLRSDAEKINNFQLQKLAPGKLYKCSDHAPQKKRDRDIFFSDVMYPAEIDIRVGAPVILKKNLNISGGLTNGTRGIIVSVDPVVVDFGGKQTPIGREKQKIVIDEIEYHREQLPLILGWALTIHQAQGQTLSKVALIVRDYIEKKLLYVAMSRVNNISCFAKILFV